MKHGRTARRTGPKLHGSVRARITLLYGGVSTAITACVLIAALRLQQYIVDKSVRDLPADPGAGTGPCPPGAQGTPCPTAPPTTTPTAPPGTKAVASGREGFQQTLVNTQRLVTLLAIAVVAVLAFAVCWWLTGRLLRPLHRITATARRLSLSTLHERIALTGPQDELKDLADTFDAMLDRLEHAVASQRRFAANASHELRTPLAIQRAALEIGLADSTPERVAQIRTELIRTTERSERLIEGLLALAQGEQGLDTQAPVDLAVVAGQVVQEHRVFADARDITIDVTTRPVTVLGDEVMITRLVANLVQNAIRHNHPGGRVGVELSPDRGITVSNTGPHVPPDRIGELFEPFRRLHRDRTGSTEGAGLGLSIAAAIINAHGGAVRTVANHDGGLTITVNLPAPARIPH
ncbi:HAMP domain-containing sensor histidine kinase [Streptomyces sp. NPDC091371]|uniref:sensor histidine kinase n=1 Tax=Streptomyces sp. NPDC091371 TaxID=3155303 RepID=UPI003434069E